MVDCRSSILQHAVYSMAIWHRYISSSSSSGPGPGPCLCQIRRRTAIAIRRTLPQRGTFQHARILSASFNVFIILPFNISRGSCDLQNHAISQSLNLWKTGLASTIF
jgi:hypothetical protein